jgi:transcription elongation factor GreA
MAIKKIYLTKSGLEELKQEFAELTNTKRPQVVQRVAEAREMGDLAENAEYAAAREELSFIDGRIEELEELLKQVIIITDQITDTANQVKIGSQVTVKYNGKETIFNVVGEWEADPAEKKISHESPLGKALIGKKIGDKVDVTAPAGKIKYTIIDIK